MEKNKVLSLSGTPKPQLLFIHPNNDQGEYLIDIHVCTKFGMSVTSKGRIYIHQIPSFEATQIRCKPNVVSCMIQDNNHIIILHTTKPFIYDTSFAITTSYLKWPMIQSTGRNLFIAGSYSENMLVGVTSSSALCLWDVRSSENPHVLTLPSNLNVQSISILNDIIVIGQKNGKISVLDGRNMNRRLSSVDIGSQISNISFNNHFEISQSPFEPWIIGFQFSRGPAGIVDLMSKNVIKQIEQPEYEVSMENRYAKPKPLFYRNAICFGYSFSKSIQVLNSDYIDQFCIGDMSDSLFEYEKLIELESCPVSFAAVDDIDGIFAASASGEIFHVF